MLIPKAPCYGHPCKSKEAMNKTSRLSFTSRQSQGKHRQAVMHMTVSTGFALPTDFDKSCTYCLKKSAGRVFDMYAHGL